eukprot:CAMPEP_0202861066 /NCGR_PEP_ID=MMETSP1391-20130828/2593_1 /ASSEMBLY_ACC=CAM_ASM_000867 /TAXON_ID=1034604 /ORGANISM="Chlamydomonas leiostraca, Strain SAG 11-49" /LENGTH=35 /DNA_ID= /DNA_START= /DNA_END= /DNA_ORIENTATION=
MGVHGADSNTHDLITLAASADQGAAAKRQAVAGVA